MPRHIVRADAPLPKPVEVRALANPKPVRDLLRGVAFGWIPQAAAALADPDVKMETKHKIWETMLKYALGQPSMAEVMAAASDSEIQEAKALGLMKEALADPGVLAWAREHRPELLRSLVVAAEQASPGPEDVVRVDDPSA
jgi:hypothetical protein